MKKLFLIFLAVVVPSANLSAVFYGKENLAEYKKKSPKKSGGDSVGALHGTGEVAGVLGGSAAAALGLILGLSYYAWRKYKSAAPAKSGTSTGTTKPVISEADARGMAADIRAELSKYIHGLKGAKKGDLKILIDSLGGDYAKLAAIDYSDPDGAVLLIRGYTKEALKKLFDFMGADVTEADIRTISRAKDPADAARRLITKKVIEPWAEKYGVDDKIMSDVGDLEAFKQALAKRMADAYGLAKIQLKYRNGTDANLSDFLDLVYDEDTKTFRLRFDFSKANANREPLLDKKSIKAIRDQMGLKSQNSIDIYPQDLKPASVVTVPQYVADEYELGKDSYKAGNYIKAEEPGGGYAYYEIEEETVKGGTFSSDKTVYKLKRVTEADAIGKGARDAGRLVDAVHKAIVPNRRGGIDNGVSVAFTEREYMINQLSQMVTDKNVAEAVDLARHVIHAYDTADAKSVYLRDAGLGIVKPDYYEVGEDGTVEKLGSPPEMGEGDVMITV